MGGGVTGAYYGYGLPWWFHTATKEGQWPCLAAGFVHRRPIVALFMDTIAIKWPFLVQGSAKRFVRGCGTFLPALA